MPTPRSAAAAPVADPGRAPPGAVTAPAPIPAARRPAGMRNWTYDGAEGVLRMRAAKHDGSFDELWKQEPRLAA